MEKRTKKRNEEKEDNVFQLMNLQFFVDDTLYQQFCNWINLPSTRKQYGNRRWKAMKEKLELQGKNWFCFGGIQDLETAKKIMSEVFYPDQEKYYKQLEKWAECEIEDKDCSNWIRFFLWKGRTMHVSQVRLLKYKGNIEKGKAFLLAKYEEKLEWDKKKQNDKLSRHASLFDTFDENYNSFQQVWTNFDNECSLFPVCVCSNIDAKYFPKISMFGDWADGIKMQHDTIQYGIWGEYMTLVSTNRFFYTYRSKYKKSNIKFIIYSDKSFKLIKKYLQEILPEVSLNDNIVGCVTMIDYTSKSQVMGITALLSNLKEDYACLPKVLTKFDCDKKCLASRGFQNSIGYRLFTNAAIYNITNKIGYPINLPLDKTISDVDFKSLTDKIESKMNELTFEDLYLCHFIDTKYKFPTDQTDVFSIFRLSRRINLFHDVQFHYSTPIFQEYRFPYGKIVTQYKNYEFKKNLESVGGDFYKYRDEIHGWLDKNNKYFLFNLRTLCFLNWVYVNNDTGNIKKLTTLWLYHILFNCHIKAYQSDKAFFSSLLYYMLIQNERIFMIILNRLMKVEAFESIGKYDSFPIFYNLVRYYSNNFKGWGKDMSYGQLKLLNGGKKNHELLKLFSKKRTCNTTIGDTKVLAFSSKISDFIANLLVKDNHQHTEILDIFKDMEPFEIPTNFSDSSRTTGYCEYDGDYIGTYSHDVMGYTNDEIDTIFDGNPDAYWNID